MNSWRYSMMIFLGLVAILQGCSQSGIDKATSESETPQKSVTDLQSQLSQAKQSLAKFEDENQRLAAELQAAGVKSNMA